MLARRRAPLTNGRIHRIQFNAHHRLSDTRVPAFVASLLFSRIDNKSACAFEYTHVLQAT